MKTTTAVIDEIQRHTRRIAEGRESVSPGQPTRFTEACVPGDTIWQGDLGLVLVASIPAGYARVEHPTDSDRQLVPGNTQGAKHCLDALEGVALYRPADWSADSLFGHCLALTAERTIEHPTHGAVTIPAGFTVHCRYQREFDAEQRRERRVED